MKEAFNYFLLMIFFYCVELLIFNLVLLASSLESVSVNFIIRTSMVILFAKVVKKYIFPDTKKFFKLFYLLAAINPILSSFLLWLISEFFVSNINYIKIAGDVITSLVLFVILKKATKN